MRNNRLKLLFRAMSVLVIMALYLQVPALASGKGYRIHIQIKGISDTVCYLANYYGDKIYLADTAVVGKDGTFIFEGDSALPGGIYILAEQSNNKYFELLVDRAQRFSVKTSMEGIPGDLEFEGSGDNTLFYYYINESVKRRKQIELLSQQIKSLDGKSAQARPLDERIKLIEEGLSRLEDSIIASNPGSFVSVILKAKHEPEPAPDRFLPDGKKDSVFAYQSYKQHYWDNLDPADERLLRTPLYHKRLKNYFENVIYQDPDTLIVAADHFIERAKSNKETFKYAVWYLTYKFETSNIMGFDEIFVHMVDNYYAEGVAYWADSTILKSLKKRADELRNVLIGNQSPDLILLDTANGFQSLYSVDAEYVIILFYEYGCSHCKKEIKELKAWHPDSLYNLKIFAVNTDTNLAAWKKFIRRETRGWINVNGTRSVTSDYHNLYDVNVTPTIYLLDERKRILAKRLKTEQLIPFMRNLQGEEAN